MKQPNIENIFNEHDAEFLGMLDEFKSQSQPSRDPTSDFTAMPDFQSIEWELEYNQLLIDTDAGNDTSHWIESPVPELPEPKWNTAAPKIPQTPSQTTQRPSPGPTLSSRILPTNHEDDGAVDVLLDLIDDTKNIIGRVKNSAKAAGVTPLRTAAVGVAAVSVLSGSGVANRQSRPPVADQAELVVDTTAAALGHSMNIEGVQIKRGRESTNVTIPTLSQPNQDPIQSASDASNASGLDRERVAVAGDQLILPTNITSDQIVSAVISAAAPDILPAESPVVEEKPEPSKPLEQMTDTEYIEWLADSVEVSAADYEKFDVDESRVGAFDAELSGETIKPTAFVGHWTAGVYQNGVDQFVQAIKGRDGNCCSVMYFMDRNAKVYRFVASDQKTAHAKGANDYSQGVEIEARDLKDYTPEQMSAFVMLGYRFMTANDIPIERKNFIGHMELGTGKIDMPPELVDKLFVKLQKLDAEIRDNNGVEHDLNGQKQDLTNESGRDQAVGQLLTEIRSNEGNFDSINRGVAGDTKTYGDDYFAVLGGKKLSELTIRQVMELQAADKIMAIGGYQFVPGTFKSAVQATKIDVDRLFDEAAQNELAVDYLLFGGKRPNLTAYLTGKSDDLDAAMQDMCQEWASIPCANGVSYYAGDSAGNAAHGGKEQHQKIRQLLVNIRQAGSEKVVRLEPEQAIAPEQKRTGSESVDRNNRVVVIGDSLTVGYTKFGNIQEVDQASDLEVIVADGVGGRPLVGGQDDGVAAVERHIEDIKTADSVVIGLGTNAPESDETYKAEMDKLIARIQSKEVNPKANILLIKGYSYQDGTKSADRRDRRAVMLEELAAKYSNVQLIDLENVLTDDMFSGDNIHLTSSGYQTLTAEILKQTADLLKAQQPVEDVVKTEPPKPEQPLARVPEGSFAWFGIEQTKHIFEPYFRNSQGEIDQQGLDRWIGSIERAVDSNGVIKYRVIAGAEPQ